MSIIAVRVHAQNGGEHHRLRVTPDYDLPGLSIANEVNVYRAALYNNLFLDYLTQDGWDVGINTFNLPMAGVSKANGREFDTYLNVTKFFFLEDDWIIGVGTQNGTNFSGGGRQLHNFDFGQATYEYGDWLKLSAGAYYVNDSLSQSRQNVGSLVGIDVEFIDHILWMEMDWLSGKNNLSGAVVNQFWRATDLVILYAGVQVPATQSGNSFAGIVGLVLDLD